MKKDKNGKIEKFAMVQVLAIIVVMFLFVFASVAVVASMSLASLKSFAPAVIVIVSIFLVFALTSYQTARTTDDEELKKKKIVEGKRLFLGAFFIAVLFVTPFLYSWLKKLP